MLFLLGAKPPPLGGVSVYCTRRLNQLEENNIPFKHFDSKKKFNLISLILDSWILRLKKVEHTIEVNVSNPFVLAVLLMAGISSKCVFFDHNGSRRLIKKPFYKYIFTKFYRRCKHIQVVNASLKNNYCSIENISVKLPFLKPSPLEVELACKAFPCEFNFLFDNDLEERNIILTTAWKAVSTDNEYDLYGLLETLNIYKDLLPEFQFMNFVLMIGELGTSEFELEVLDKINALRNFSNFIFITGGVSQLPLLKNTKLLLRLTKTDGDSVSVREALHFNVKVIATDVTTRPFDVELVPPQSLDFTKNKILTYLNSSKG